MTCACIAGLPTSRGGCQRGAEELRRRHAQNSMGQPVDEHRSTGDLGVSAKLLLPESVAQRDDGISTWIDIIAWPQHAASNGRTPSTSKLFFQRNTRARTHWTPRSNQREKATGVAKELGRVGGLQLSAAAAGRKT